MAASVLLEQEYHRQNMNAGTSCSSKMRHSRRTPRIGRKSQMDCVLRILKQGNDSAPVHGPVGSYGITFYIVIRTIIVRTHFPASNVRGGGGFETGEGSFRECPQTSTGIIMGARSYREECERKTTG